MQLQRSADRLWYRTALFIAFVAMSLLLVGPLISQYQANGEHHADHKASHHTGDHHQHAAPQASNNHQHHTSHVETLEPIFTWFHQCGYCAVWQQFPTTHTFLPAISLQAFIKHNTLLTQPKQAMQSCDNYPHALTRAPPFFRFV
ncbi:DUF2946 domain-containing protein [Vreelandella profundi]|uniref:DUF2946 domain-containing protein n=1 Tax=Vreelandella profundi TaxID=2852117 RepID=UPI001EF00DD5|nr:MULTISPECIES: DUF2946 domain-containing protein [Halomonas]MDN7132305.1 DUF2946 domain-containing protein [Halomonas sp. MC140]